MLERPLLADVELQHGREVATVTGVTPRKASIDIRHDQLPFRTGCDLALHPDDALLRRDAAMHAEICNRIEAAAR